MVDKRVDDKIKGEIQTSKGILKEIKDNELPSTTEMARITLDNYFKNSSFKNEGDFINYLKKNTSEFLKEIIILETKLYNEFEENVYRIFMDYYLKNHHKDPQNPYKELEKLVIDLENKYQDIKFKDIGLIIKDIYPAIRHVVFSAYQSRKTRVGKTLEHYIEYILQILDIPFQEQVDITDSIIDFALPNEDVFHSYPEEGVFIAAQTTLKDRFRLSLGKLPSKFNQTKKYIMTAGGLNIITDKDDEDLTRKKIHSIDNQNFEVVVFKELKDRKFSDESIVISFETFINDRMPEEIELWKREGWI